MLANVLGIMDVEYNFKTLPFDAKGELILRRNIKEYAVIFMKEHNISKHIF